MGPCRAFRSMQTTKHVKNWDQIEKEKNMHDSKSLMSNSDSLSKILLVQGSMTQFLDMITDYRMLVDLYLVG